MPYKKNHVVIHCYRERRKIPSNKDKYKSKKKFKDDKSNKLFQALFQTELFLNNNHKIKA